MASWARQQQQITEAADGGARARTGADGAVVLNLRRGPGAYALLSRADGQLTRAGQHYYSHLGLPPGKDFDYNQPLIREGPNDYILLRNGQKKLVRSLQGGEHRLTKLGKGFFRDKYYEYLVHVPVIIRGRRRSGRNAGAGYKRRDWLPVNELGGATKHPAHLTEEQGGCMYGTLYRKQTRLWTNMRWRPRQGLCKPGSRCKAWQDGRHLRAAQRGPRLMEGQYERVSQSRELLYSVPAALCEEIARAATEELAERLSIPD